MRMAEDDLLLRDKVYNRVNELVEQSPGVSRQEIMEEVRKEMGFEKLTTVSANYYRGRSADPTAAPAKRGRPKGSKNKTTLEREAAAGTSTGSATATVVAATPRARRSTATRAAAGKATTRRSATSRSSAVGVGASTADLSKAVETLNNLVAENQRLNTENRDMREQLGRISDIAAG